MKTQSGTCRKANVLGTKSNIAFAVVTLSIFTSFLRTKHPKARFHYLNGTIHTGFTYTQSESPIPIGFATLISEAQLSKKVIHPISGYIFFLAGGLVSWSAKGSLLLLHPPPKSSI